MICLEKSDNFRNGCYPEYCQRNWKLESGVNSFQIRFKQMKSWKKLSFAFYKMSFEKSTSSQHAILNFCLLKTTLDRVRIHFQYSFSLKTRYVKYGSKIHTLEQELCSERNIVFYIARSFSVDAKFLAAKTQRSVKRL